MTSDPSGPTPDSGRTAAARPVLVLGATGNQGGAVARTLLADGHPVRAFVRDPGGAPGRALADAGAELVVGDLGDRAALLRGAGGVHGLFYVLPFFATEQARETELGRQVADVARTAGVEHFVYSSAAGAHRNTGVPHIESKWLVEQHVRYIDLPFTVLRPVAFNNSLAPHREPALRDGVLSDPRAGSSRVPEIAEDDFARFVSLALREPDTWIDRAVDVAGDVVTVSQMAEIFGRVLGRPVEHVRTGWTRTRATRGGEITRLVRWVEDVGSDVDVAAMTDAYPWLTPLERWLADHGRAPAPRPGPAAPPPAPRYGRGGWVETPRARVRCCCTASARVVASTAAVTMVAPCSAYRAACAPPRGACTPTGTPAATARVMTEEITACTWSRSVGPARPRDRPRSDGPT